MSYPLPPSDTQAEHGVIGAVLLDERRLQIPAVAQLRVADFAEDAHARIWQVIRAEREQGKPLDLQVIARRLAEQPGEPLGLPFISKLIESAGTGYAAEYFAEVVADKSRLRRQWRFARKLTEQIAAGLPSEDVAGYIERHHEEEQSFGARSQYELRSFGAMKKTIKGLKPVVIDGIARAGETMNLISAPKIGKSWMGGGLALSVCVGAPWLDRFATTAGEVLIIDNELHPETLAHRIPQIAAAMGIREAEYQDRLFIHCLRGRLVDINGLAELFKRIEPGRFKLVLLDALYRLLPDGSEENSNSDMKRLYDRIDHYAERLGATFCCIHHTSKGSQSGKATTDVGAGAGSQSRACDAHIVLRQHEQDGAIVVDGNVRSFAPLAPFCVRWEFPVWVPADDLDPALLKPDRPRKAKPKEDAPGPLEPGWTPKRVADELLKREPQSQAAIIEAAMTAGLSERRAKKLLDLAAKSSPPMAYLWLTGDRRQKQYANCPQTTLSVVSEVAE